MKLEPATRFVSRGPIVEPAGRIAAGVCAPGRRRTRSPGARAGGIERAGRHSGQATLPRPQELAPAAVHAPAVTLLR